MQFLEKCPGYPIINLIQPVKTIHPNLNSIAALACLLFPSLGAAQTFDNNNNRFQQPSNGTSVRGANFNFQGGNDRLILLRNDDLAGLGSGTADMGSGRDVVVTSFEMSGGFNLGTGNDLFVCEGDVAFNANATDIIVLGGAGNDIIAVTTDSCDYRGEAGNDVFVSDGSNNVFDGGDGKDTYSVEFAESAASIDLAADNSFVRFTFAERIFNIENVRGSNFGDEIFGDVNANRIDGLGGDDSIDGDLGDDTISGGAGTNTLIGNLGFDTLVIEGVVTSKTRISLTTIRVIGTLPDGKPFNHTATGFEQVLDNGVIKAVVFFMGESSTDFVQQTVIAETPVLPTITALVAGQTLNGNGSANTIGGGAGSDDIAGLDGNDTLKGQGGDDWLFGGNGNDTMDGGTGDDTLDGGPGSDRLTGGPGKDIFLFSTALSGGADVITDYKVTEDTIRIFKSLVGNLPTGDLAATAFKNTAQGAVDADDRIIYESSTGKLFFDSNGSAAGGRVLIATLPTGRNMVPAEIKIQ